MIPSGLLELPVVRADGSSVDLGALVDDHPTLLLFIRRFGCIACSEWVTAIAPQLQSIARLGVKAVVIGSGTPEEMREFTARFELGHLPVTLVTDPTLRSFKAMGLIQSWFGTYGPRAIIPLFRALAEGHRNRPRGGDATQLGGVVLLNQGKIAFLHRSAYFGDNPKMGALMEAVVRVAAEGALV